MFIRASIALRIADAWASVITFDFTYSVSGMSREARRRIVNAGPETTGGKSPFEAVPTNRKFAGDDRPLVIGLRLQGMRNTADDNFGCGGAHRAGRCHAVPEPLDEQPAVRIEHDLDHCRVIERDAELVAKCVLQFADQAGMGSELGHAALLSNVPSHCEVN